jgi:hypothetical protein
MIDRSSVIKIVSESKLTASELVDASGGLVSMNQAYQWLKFGERGKKLSNPVMYLLWRIARDKMEKSVGKKELISTENDLPKVETKFKGNSFLTNDKINVMEGSFIRKANGVYFNIGGDIYLNEGVDVICIFEKEGKERKVKIGSGTFGKWEIIS